MHICFIITRGDLIGGAQIHVRDTASALIQDGHKVSVIVGSPGEFTDQMTERNIDWYEVPSLVRSIQPLKDLSAIRKLRKLIRSLNPDIVSTHTAKAGMVGRIAAFTTGYDSIFTAHGWQFADGIPAKQAKPVLYIEKMISRLCKKVITVSQYDYELAVRKKAVPLEKLAVIHNGLPWRDVISSRAEGVGSEPLRLLMVARFQPQKDHDTLFRALSELRHLPWILNLVGDGPDREVVEELSNSLNLSDRIIFLGQRRDVPEIMEHSDVYLLISNWEGFPRSIVEAMRAGLPVITSGVGGCGEAVSHGESGYVVNVNDVGNLKNYLELILKNPELRIQMGAVGRSRYETYFTFKSMYEKTVDIYQEIIH